MVLVSGQSPGAGSTVKQMIQQQQHKVVIQAGGVQIQGPPTKKQKTAGMCNNMEVTLGLLTVSYPSLTHSQPCYRYVVRFTYKE